MISAVDTNILIDILRGESPDSVERLAEAVGRGGAIICEAVYSEMAPLFDSPELLDTFLEGTGVRVERSSSEALYRAGLAWRTYNRQRPRFPVCPQCGVVQQLACDSCGAALEFRQHTLADFLIGGHAAVHADRLITRDRRAYPRYFPELTLA
ncbi:MAG: type II toxin-antitoxin system VapC family toxin [Gemmatimonadetes bacterium]|nr:type II toxin-antitoxin system VapC family toxin [Gemmatimonadota bacterium]